MSMKQLLRDEIESELGELGKLELGSDEYRKTVEGVTKLIDKTIEIDKVEMESDEQYEKRKIETQLKLQQMEDEKKDRRVKNAISLGGILLPLGVTIWGALKSWEFEKEGTVTTSFGRMFMNCFRPKK